MKKVLILGATGMLGRAVKEAFDTYEGDVTLSVRRSAITEIDSGANVISFDAEKQSLSSVTEVNFDYVINCIGLIKSLIDPLSAESLKLAVKLNVNLPLGLSDFASKRGSRVIQIATDCVYSGSKGSYFETDLHDPLDVYGKTKSLGEVPSENMMHIRASIIGKETRGHTSLYDWVRFQPQGAQISGFTDHFWNGVPAVTLGRIYRAIIENDLFLPGVHHLVPSNVLTKAQLVSAIAQHEGRDDLEIHPNPSGNPTDRSLATNNPSFSSGLWEAIGYTQAPTIEDLVDEI